jgi:dihydroorotate dehydrogenase
MIYQGPQLIGEINYDLVKLLNQDNYHHIQEAVGKESKNFI